MSGRLIFLLLTIIRSDARNLSRHDKHACFDKSTSVYYCCSGFEEINYECIECKTGFQSRNGHGCETCMFNFFGKMCIHECNCNNLQRCDSVKGCVAVETTGIPKVVFSDDNMTTEHKDNENDGTGISKTELLMLYSGALSGIIVILGMLGILYCINRRICKPKSKHVKTSKADILQPAEHEIQDTLELHERLYEEIDESKFESILHSPTCSPNLNKVDGSLGVDSVSNCNLNTINKSLGQENGNSQKAVSLLKTFNKGIVVQSSFCYPVIEEDLSSSESREDCDYDRTSYLHPYNILSAKRSSNSNSTVESNYDRTSYLHPYNTLSVKRLHYHTPERVTNAVQSKNDSD